MTGYTTREVAQALGLAPSEIRAFARSGLLEPERGPRNEYRFSFQDVVLLKTAKGLRDASIPAGRIRRTLLQLRSQLPEGRPLSAVHVAAQGEHVVVRDRDTVWEPETGQVTFDFSVGELAARVEAFVPRVVGERTGAGTMDADAWFDLGYDLEAVSPGQATAAYLQALERDPTHADAHLNLGRLLHEEGRVEDAARHYRSALESDPASSLAVFNLGVALEDLGRMAEAVDAYRRALDLDERLPAAHYNLARLCERSGDATGAFRHLKAYKRLLEGGSGGRR